MTDIAGYFMPSNSYYQTAFWVYFAMSLSIETQGLIASFLCLGVELTKQV